MDIGLGRFGDRRLEKGGSFFSGGLLSWADASFACVSLEAIERERSG